MGDNPDVQWALDLLTKDPNYVPNVLSEYAGEICGVIAGLGTGVGTNIVRARPMFSGVQIHIMLMLGGFAFGKLLKAKEEYVTRRHDAVLRDYIIRHPELFPQPERKKYSEVLMPWIPLR